MNDYITILGTGNAHATRCYNTFFVYLHQDLRRIQNMK